MGGAASIGSTCDCCPSPRRLACPLDSVCSGCIGWLSLLECWHGSINRSIDSCGAFIAWARIDRSMDRSNELSIGFGRGPHRLVGKHARAGRSKHRSICLDRRRRLVRCSACCCRCVPAEQPTQQVWVVATHSRRRRPNRTVPPSPQFKRRSRRPWPVRPLDQDGRKEDWGARG